MSFSHTKDQVRNGAKTVTRRMGWDHLKKGEEFCAIEKGMGLKKGEKVVPMAILRCVSNRPECLDKMIRDTAYGEAEAVKEGFAWMSGRQFVEFFCEINRQCTPESRPNRIEFEYVRFLP